jgi:3-dehydro-L-gulonate-6-phosphate decarboxylase
MGVQQVIFKRSRDLEAQGQLSWGEGDFDTIRRLRDLGFKVTATGGVKPSDIPLFAGVPVYIFIAGRAIVQAGDPAAAAKAFQDALQQTYALHGVG